MDPRWQHPFTCIVAGPTGCGKTTFVARLLRNASEMIDPPPERVTWYYDQGTRGQAMAEILILVDQTRGDQGTRGPATVMAEIVEKRGPGDQGTGTRDG